MGSCDHFTHPSLFNTWTFQHLMCLCTSENLESKNAVYFGDLPKYNFLLPATRDYMQFPCHRRLHAISLQWTNFLVSEFVPFFLMHLNSSVIVTSVFTQWKAEYEVSYTISYPFVKVFEKWIIVTCLGACKVNLFHSPSTIQHIFIWNI